MICHSKRKITLVNCLKRVCMIQNLIEIVIKRILMKTYLIMCNRKQFRQIQDNQFKELTLKLFNRIKDQEFKELQNLCKAKVQADLELLEVVLVAELVVEAKLVVVESVVDLEVQQEKMRYSNHKDHKMREEMKEDKLHLLPLQVYLMLIHKTQM